MATPASQLDQLIATTFDKYRPTLADNISTKVSVLAVLESKAQVKQDGGLTIRLPLMHALNGTVGSYSGYDVLDTTPQGGFGHAEFQWRQLAGSVTISGEEERKNAGSSQIINLLSAKFRQLELSFVDELGNMFWATSVGNGGKDLLSIPVIVEETGILGGIDPSDAAFWKSTVVSKQTDGSDVLDLTSTAGIKRINNILNTLMINTSKPDVIFTTQAVFEAYEDVALSKLELQNTRLADLGFTTVSHKGTDIILEAKVPVIAGYAGAGTNGGPMYFVNTGNLMFFQHSQAWMKRLPFAQPYNQDARTALVISMGNLATDMRRAHGLAKYVKTA